MSALPPKAHIAEGKRDICFVPKRTHSLQQYPPNLIARGAVTQKQRRTNFSLQWRLRQGLPQKETASLVRNTARGWGACWLTLASKLGGPNPRGIFLCNGRPPFVPH